MTPRCSSGWRLQSFLRVRLCGRASPSLEIVSANRDCGRTPSPATCRSSLVRIGADRNLELVRQVLQAHAYWRRCGLVADLVLLHDDGAGDELRRQLEDLVQNAPTAELVDRPGGVFLRDASRISADDVTLLEAAARVVLRGSDGPLAAQLGRARAAAPPLPLPLRTTRDPEKAASQGLTGAW